MTEIKENPARQANMGGVQYLPVNSPTLNKHRLVQPLCLVFAYICTVCLNVTRKKKRLPSLRTVSKSIFSGYTKNTGACQDFVMSVTTNSETELKQGQSNEYTIVCVCGCVCWGWGGVTLHRKEHLELGAS